MNPLVSVIIPTFNRKTLLRRAIKSVFAQTFRNFELIIIDDGSTDGTAKTLVTLSDTSPRQAPIKMSSPNVLVRHKALAESVPKRFVDESRRVLWRIGDTKRDSRLKLAGMTAFFPQTLSHPIQLIRQKHRGVSAARNAGIKLAKGKYIAFLDSDDEWLPEKLERQIQFFRENPRAMVCQTEEIWIRNGRRANPMAKHKKYSGRIFKHCLPLCIVSPSATMMKRTLFDRVGCFDESLPACEDYDLWLRVSARFPIHLIDEPLIVKYGGHADQLSRKIRWLDRYRIQALVKILRATIHRERLTKRKVQASLHPTLSKTQFKWTLDEFERKCRIYGRGCLKHGKKKEGNKILLLPDGVPWGSVSRGTRLQGVTGRNASAYAYKMIL